jgi:polyhydroxybutyrate depolymerase
MSLKLVIALILAALLSVASARPFQSLQGLANRTFEVNGQQRQGLVYPASVGATKPGSPLIFVFHGHGGTAEAVARRYALHRHWPEAVVVYLQGLPTVGALTDPEGKRAGWQSFPGTQEDRDVKLFDTVLATLQKEYRTDPNRVYLLGHSNGSRFANVLWSVRGEKIAALCSSSGQGGQLLRNAPPRSVFIIAGEKDPLVPYAGQMRSSDESEDRRALTHRTWNQWDGACHLPPSRRARISGRISPAHRQILSATDEKIARFQGATRYALRHRSSNLAGCGSRQPGPATNARCGCYICHRFHSHRRAVIGSTFIARRAGIQQASSATNVSNSVVRVIVNGSTADMPNNIFDINRVKKNEAAKPSATPSATNFIPWPTISFKTVPVCAPSAIRMPISCVRWATECAMTL